MIKTHYLSLKGPITFIFVMLLGTMSVLAQSQKAKIQITDEKGKKVWTYEKSNTLYVKVAYKGQDILTDQKDSFFIVAKSELEPGGEHVKVTETDISTGIFEGKIDLNKLDAAVPGNQKLEVQQGDKLTVIYKVESDSKASPVDAMDQCFYRGPQWTFQNTGHNHIVLIPDFAKITIDGEPLEFGDFISVFYEKKDGEKKTLVNAGGTGMEVAPGGVRYTGNTMTIAVWGEQESKNNGFATGEEMKWKIWRAKDQKVYDAVATYMPLQEGQPFSHQGTYAKDGISGITELKAKTKK